MGGSCEDEGRATRATTTATPPHPHSHPRAQSPREITTPDDHRQGKLAMGPPTEASKLRIPPVSHRGQQTLQPASAPQGPKGCTPVTHQPSDTSATPRVQRCILLHIHTLRGPPQPHRASTRSAEAGFRLRCGMVRPMISRRSPSTCDAATPKKGNEKRKPIASSERMMMYFLRGAAGAAIGLWLRAASRRAATRHKASTQAQLSLLTARRHLSRHGLSRLGGNRHSARFLALLNDVEAMGRRDRILLLSLLQV